MKGSYEVRVHDYSRKKVHNGASNLFHDICQWRLLVQAFSLTCMYIYFNLIMSLILWQEQGWPFWNIVSSKCPQQSETMWKSSRFSLFSILYQQKTMDRNTKPGLSEQQDSESWPVSCPVGRKGDKSFKPLLKLLCSHVSQSILLAASLIYCSSIFIC